MPRIIVLAGPNGAGKSTAARTLLADEMSVLLFVNADVIAQGLAGFHPEEAAVEASRIMLERLRQLAERGVDFAFETTLSGRTYATWLHDQQQRGYLVQLVYFWLDHPELAVERVRQRVLGGGHDIPTRTIYQRYQRSIRNLFSLYLPIVDEWEIYDNSQPTYQLIAEGTRNGPMLVFNSTCWQRMNEMGRG